MQFFSGQSEHVILDLSCKGGVGKSTVCDTDSMESLQQREEGKLETLRSVQRILPNKLICIKCIVFVRPSFYQNQ